MIGGCHGVVAVVTVDDDTDLHNRGMPDLYDEDTMWLIRLMTIPNLHDSGCHVVDTVDDDTRSA